MKIIATSRAIFEMHMVRNKVTSDNVEEFKNIAFISINNQDDKEPPYFPKDKENVKVLVFGDINEDITVPLLDTREMVVIKAMTVAQAQELYEFIKKHQDKETIIVHCTAGIARSGAIATFINDYTSSNWDEFRRLNPHIVPNHHVYKLLHDCWYEDHKYLKDKNGNRV